MTGYHKSSDPTYDQLWINLSIVFDVLTNYYRWKGADDSLPKKPEPLRAKSFYMRGLVEGTYRYWSASSDYEARKKVDEMHSKEWEEKSKLDTQKGVQEKKAAIAKLIEEFERAEKALITAGGKTFAEMHPDIKQRERPNNQPYQQPNPAPYETTFHFRDPALNDIKRDGYKQMFEAAWDNDLEKIKAITLAPWTWRDSKVMEPPLKVAIQDGNGFSPFSIAVLRGHRELAKKIVEICATQYHADDGLNSRRRWNMRTGTRRDYEDSDCGDSDYDESDDGEGKYYPIPNIVRVSV